MGQRSQVIPSPLQPPPAPRIVVLHVLFPHMWSLSLHPGLAQNNTWFQLDDGKIHTFKLLSWLHYHKHGRRFPKVILVETEQTELQTK